MKIRKSGNRPDNLVNGRNEDVSGRLAGVNWQEIVNSQGGRLQKPSNSFNLRKYLRLTGTVAPDVVRILG
jgi:hypothetical protein